MNIIEPNQDFNFNNLTLSNPIGIQGGAYFTKILYNEKPLYIQTTKGLTKQGFIKSGKKYYCDLMFDNNSEKLINWFEKFEEQCQKLILEKGESWFQNNLELNDIENAFNPIIKIYKSGKFYLIRTNVKNSALNEPTIKIYNESEIPLFMSDITNETNIISILEIQGIKFTSRSFQFEIEIKQIMVINDEIIFDNCLIKNKKNINLNISNNFKIPLENTKTEDNLEKDNLEKYNLEKDNLKKDNLEKDNLEEDNLEEDNLKKDNLKKDNLEDTLEDLENENNLKDTLEDLENENNLKDTLEDLENKNNLKNTLEDLENKNNLENLNKLENNILINVEELSEDKELIEVNLNFENNLETLTLKKPNEVYAELYKEARKKAKQAKKSAIIAYLEAKNIKKTYMLENLNDSDNDFDDEIDEVSESELDNL